MFDQILKYQTKIKLLMAGGSMYEMIHECAGSF